MPERGLSSRRWGAGYPTQTPSMWAEARTKGYTKCGSTRLDIHTNNDRGCLGARSLKVSENSREPTGHEGVKRILKYMGAQRCGRKEVSILHSSVEHLVHDCQLNRQIQEAGEAKLQRAVPSGNLLNEPSRLLLGACLSSTTPNYTKSSFIVRFCIILSLTSRMRKESKSLRGPKLRS
jgi:hypothetical protein